MSKIIGFFGGWQGYALVAVVAAAIAASGAWGLQNVIWGKTVADLKTAQAEKMTEVANAATEQVAANIKFMKQLSSQIGALDIKGFKEMLDAKMESDKVAADLASGARSMWVRIRLPAGGCGTGFRAAAPRVGYATAYAELDEEFARSLLGIAGRGDAAIIQLTTMQGYAAKVSAPREPVP